MDFAFFRIVFGIVFCVVLVTIVIGSRSVFSGIRRQRKLMDRAFDQAEDELDRQAEFDCRFCGTLVEGSSTCTQCGAPRSSES